MSWLLVVVIGEWLGVESAWVWHTMLSSRVENLPMDEDFSPTNVERRKEKGRRELMIGFGV